MIAMEKQNSFTSPLKKLVSFFEKSRDKWKEKYFANKKENQKLKNKLTTLKSSQQKWKNEAIQLRKQLRQTTANTESILPEPVKKNRI
jgi:uncharacterized protein (DUF342 family)